MIKKGYYINQEKKLLKQFEKTLSRYDKKLSAQYGADFSKTIRETAIVYFIELIPNIPFYEAASYQAIIIINAQLIAIVRAMKKQGRTVEDVFKIQVELWKETYAKIPGFMGRIFVSKFGGYFLNNLAKKVTSEGWDTDYIRGTPNDDFDISIITKKCGVVEYLKSEGIDDYLKYCNSSDFIMFPAMNIGLKQPSTIENGKCVFCMKHNGQSEVPASLDAIYNPKQEQSDLV